MTHRPLPTCAVPVLFAGSHRDRVARMNGLHRPALDLCQPTALNDVKDLASAMGVPVRPRSRLKPDQAHPGGGGSGVLVQRMLDRLANEAALDGTRDCREIAFPVDGAHGQGQ